MSPPAQAGGPPTLSEGPALPGGVRSVGKRRMGVKSVGSGWSNRHLNYVILA